MMSPAMGIRGAVRQEKTAGARKSSVSAENVYRVARGVKGKVGRLSPPSREFEPHPSYRWYFVTLLSRTTKINSTRIFFRYVRSAARERERERRVATTMRSRLALSTSREEEKKTSENERDKEKEEREREGVGRRRSGYNGGCGSSTVVPSCE